MSEDHPVSRLRWAAVGAAVAITLGAGGIGVVRAAVTSGPKPVFLPITPCRLVDTRPPPANVGARATPLGPGEIATFAVHGTNGHCAIPAGALAISANVTITTPSSNGFMTVFPADAPLPNASNLNWVAGQAPTPNAVTVDLSADGKIKVFNERGTVNVIIDIVGYYDDHTHDDRYYTKAQVNSLPASSIFAGGGINRDGTLTTSLPTFGSTWTASRTGTGAYSINLPGLNPGCTNQDFPLVILTAFDDPGAIVGYNTANTTCASGNTSLAIWTTNAAGAAADVRFQFLAFLPGAAPALSQSPRSNGGVPATGGTAYSQCTITRDGAVSCS